MQNACTEVGKKDQWFLTCGLVRLLGHLRARLGNKGAQGGENIPCEARKAHLCCAGDGQEGAEGWGVVVVVCAGRGGAGQGRGQAGQVVGGRGEAAEGGDVPRREVGCWGLRVGRVVSHGSEVRQGVQSAVRG